MDLSFRHHDKETNQWRLTLTLSEWGFKQIRKGNTGHEEEPQGEEEHEQ